MRDRKQLGQIWTVPNLLSLFRLCLIPVIVWLYCFREAYPATCGVLLLSGLTDVADGFIARRFDMTSDFGKVLDPVADKLTQGAVLFCLLTRFPLMAAPILLMLGKEIYMGVTGYLVIRRTGTVLGANWHGKLNTCLLYAMMLVHIVWPGIPYAVSCGAIAVCIVMMVLSMLLYGARNRKALKQN